MLHPPGVSSHDHGRGRGRRRVSAGTTYTYFATKDEMIVATVEIAMVGSPDI